MSTLYSHTCACLFSEIIMSNRNACSFACFIVHILSPDTRDCMLYRSTYFRASYLENAEGCMFRHKSRFYPVDLRVQQKVDIDLIYSPAADWNINERDS